MNRIYPVIEYGGIKFRSVRGINKCINCDEYGRIKKMNYPNQTEWGYYYPFCDCEFGQWKKSLPDEPQMFEQQNR